MSQREFGDEGAMFAAGNTYRVWNLLCVMRSEFLRILLHASDELRRQKPPCAFGLLKNWMPLAVCVPSSVTLNIRSNGEIALANAVSSATSLSSETYMRSPGRIW